MKVGKWAFMLLLAYLLLVLTGCGEVLNEYYVSNHTETAVTITMTPYHIETADISSGSLIEDLESSARDTLTQSLDYEVVDDTIQFTLPAHTTVYLGSSFGGNDLFSGFTADFENEHLVMDVDNYGDYFELHDNFIGPIVHVFDIK